MAFRKINKGYNETLPKGHPMETKHIAAATGVTVLALVYHQFRIRAVVNAVDRICDLMIAHLDGEYQKEVDNRFETIVNNYEE